MLFVIVLCLLNSLKIRTNQQWRYKDNSLVIVVSRSVMLRPTVYYCPMRQLPIVIRQTDRDQPTQSCVNSLRGSWLLVAVSPMIIRKNIGCLMPIMDKYVIFKQARQHITCHVRWSVMSLVNLYFYKMSVSRVSRKHGTVALLSFCF